MFVCGETNVTSFVCWFKRGFMKSRDVSLNCTMKNE